MKLICLARADADALREQDREAPTGHDADARVGVGETGPIGGDEEVAVERDLEAPRHRDPVHRADQRLGVRQAARRGTRRARLRHTAEALALSHLAGTELLEVDTRRERGIGAGEDHHVDVFVGIATRDRGGQLAPHVAVQRVALIGTVQRDDRDPVGDVDEDDVGASCAPEVEGDLDRAGRRPGWRAW